MKTDYTYAAARIHLKELSLLTRADLEQLAGAADVRAALQLLSEKGWGDPEQELTAENMLRHEAEAAWEVVNDLEKDPAALSVLKLGKDYHNLKAAVKQVYTGSSLPAERLFQPGGTLDAGVILKAVEEKDWELLPAPLAQTAEEASVLLAHTGDGQLCDSLIDKACLGELYRAGKASPEEVLQEYAVVTCAAANIRIALRAARSRRPLSFLLDSMLPMEELDTKALAEAAYEGKDAVAEYLETTPFAALVPSLSGSMAAFEKSCDDLLIEHMKPQKNNSFTLGPLAAYLLARENEIKCVRMILTGKQNHLPDEVLRESLRMTYV